MVALAMDLEGNDVARRFEERGVAAFVVKYRIMGKKSEAVPTTRISTRPLSTELLTEFRR